LFEDYYFDELSIIFSEYCKFAKGADKTVEVEEVSGSDFFGF